MQGVLYLIYTVTGIFLFLDFPARKEIYFLALNTNNIKSELEYI
jgi:hypothetical protein